METMERVLPYTIKNVRAAIYAVLEQMKAEHSGSGAKDVTAEANIYGNVSRFSVTVRECGYGTAMTLSMLRPCPGLSLPGQQRALNAVADQVAQHLENVLVMNGICVGRPEGTGAEEK